MPKAAGQPRKAKTPKEKATRRKPTFQCVCTGGCKGRARELSEATYKKHTKFRELDKAENEDVVAVDDRGSKSPQQDNVQHTEHDEIVSFQTVVQETSLKYSLRFV